LTGKAVEETDSQATVTIKSVVWFNCPLDIMSQLDKIIF